MTATTERATRWLPRGTGGAEAVVLLLPYSGCGASRYHRWPAQVDGVALGPVQLPGRESRMREACPDSYEELAAWMVDEIGPLLDRPFAFFGHCGAALLAFEATRACVAAGGPAPAALFVSSQVAPHEGPYGRYLGMDDDALRTELRAVGPELGAASVDDELLDLVVPGMQRDLDLNRGYRRAAGDPLPSPIRAIGWEDDDEIPPDRMAGWSAWGSAAFDVLPGGHRAFLAAPPELLAVFASAMVPA